MRTATSTDG